MIAALDYSKARRLQRKLTLPKIRLLFHPSNVEKNSLWRNHPRILSRKNRSQLEVERSSTYQTARTLMRSTTQRACAIIAIICMEGRMPDMQPTALTRKKETIAKVYAWIATSTSTTRAPKPVRTSRHLNEIVIISSNMLMIWSPH